MDNTHPYWVYRFIQLLQADWPTYSLKYARWDSNNAGYKIPNTAGGLTTLTSGTGSNSINVWNGSVPGTTYDYFMYSSIKEALIGAIQPDLVIFNHGHNEGATLGNGNTTGGFYGQYRDRATVAIEQFRLLWPQAAILLVSQNPEPNTTAIPLLQTYRSQVLRELAQRRGYGFIDVNQAFRDAGGANADNASNPYVYTDGVHPNALGSEIWAAEVKKHFVFRRGVAPAPCSLPSLTEAADNLMLNGAFASWATTLPDNWVGTNVTANQDITNFRNGTYGCRLVPAAFGSASYIEQTINCKSLAGQWVTLSALSYTPNSQDNSGSVLGQIALLDGANTAASQPWKATQVHNSWVWSQVSCRIRTAATTLRIRLYCNPTTSSYGDITFARAVLTRGMLPKDMAGLVLA